MIVFGTRPEGIKMAPLIKTIRNDRNFKCIVINTAQHREMLDRILSFFGIETDYDLNLMSSCPTVTHVIAKALPLLDDIMTNERPDLVLVQGDTASTLAGTQAAFLRGIPVGHVEAGLRTYDLSAPFPEEGIRQMVTRIATYHFAATEENKRNLIREGIPDQDILVTGNTVIDALLSAVKKDFRFKGELDRIVNDGTRVILVTTHRRENLDRLGGIYRAINRIVREHDNVRVVFPVHRNPTVRRCVAEHLIPNERIHLIEPISDYAQFVNLMGRSYLIITDSGGIQEEAPSLGVPVLVCRDTTERPEGIAAGTLRLVGTDEERVYAETNRLLTDAAAYDVMSRTHNPYGDGRASERIVAFLRQRLISHLNQSDLT